MSTPLIWIFTLGLFVCGGFPGQVLAPEISVVTVCGILPIVAQENRTLVT
jgi:hypothetical protein